MIETRYKVAGPHITWEHFDDEYVVLDLDIGRYFSLASGAALVWRGILAGCSPAGLSAEIDADSTSKTAFETFFKALIGAHLVIADNLVPEDAGALAKDIAAVGDDFRLEAFDDLAALLIADPIHDVEAEAGWPHRPD